MTAIVIYGKAVQDARNRLRSAHISTMLDVLAALQDGPTQRWLKFPQMLATALAQLPVPDRANDRAWNALAAAKARIAQFVDNATGSVYDIFAVGDVLRQLGEYIEAGGAGADWMAFIHAVRSRIAFGENRARITNTAFGHSELPDLGIFKNRLLDRSVVKYMERVYGPYVGADISGTTTDSLAVLAYLLSLQTPASSASGRGESAIASGLEVVPIATMVLQYHHSLLECLLALTMAVPVVYGDARAQGEPLARGDFYDFTSLIDRAKDHTDTGEVGAILTRGNTTLSREFAGRRLVIVRDWIDIEGSEFLDCEIGLLVENNDAALFELGRQYQAFSDLRRPQSMGDRYRYQTGAPSLATFASRHEDALALPAIEVPGDGDDQVVTGLAALVRQSRDSLAVLHATTVPGNFFDNLDQAVAAVPTGDGSAAQAIEAPAAETTGTPAWLTPERVRALQRLIGP